MNMWKPLELLATGVASLAWPGFQAVNHRFKSQTFHPSWAPGPLLKSHERTSPQLGWPRTTDSLCPVCVRETRSRVLSGEQSLESLVGGHTAGTSSNGTAGL
jgi:tetraether lipid synthase